VGCGALGVDHARMTRLTSNICRRRGALAPFVALLACCLAPMPAAASAKASKGPLTTNVFRTSPLPFDLTGVEGGQFRPPRGVARPGQRYRKLSGRPAGKVQATAAASASPLPTSKLNSPADAIAMRNSLIQYIWKGSGLTTAQPGLVQQNVEDSGYRSLTGLYRIDKLSLSAEYGLNNYMYVFWPSGGNNNRLVIVWNGHGGAPAVMKSTIQFFLSKHFIVLEGWMPLEPEYPPSYNYPVVTTGDFGTFTLWSHDYFEWLDSTSFSPVKFFMDPVAIGINYMLRNYSIRQVAMTGLSGGAWTTTLYAALDPRVQKSYPVAGTMPIYLRSTYNVGDWEQTLADLYHTSEYMDQYALGSYGTTPGGATRDQIQILNSNDSCCFSGALYNTYPYESAVDNTLTRIGGSASQYGVYITQSSAHSITQDALNLMLQDLGP
jgi:hypothetical protein